MSFIQEIRHMVTESMGFLKMNLPFEIRIDSGSRTVIVKGCSQDNLSRYRHLEMAVCPQYEMITGSKLKFLFQVRLEQNVVLMNSSGEIEEVVVE